MMYYNDNPAPVHPDVYHFRLNFSSIKIFAQEQNAKVMIRLLNQLVAPSICAKCCSGLLVRLWPGWIVQLVHISFYGAHTTALQPKGQIAHKITKMANL